MKGDNSYKPEINERVLISPPNSDNEEGWCYSQFEVYWLNDTFILYGNENMYPNLNKLEHCHIKRVSVVEKYYRSEYPNVDVLSHMDIEIIKLIKGYDKLVLQDDNKVLISKEEYEILKRDSESLKQVNYLD